MVVAFATLLSKFILVFGFDGENTDSVLLVRCAICPGHLYWAVRDISNPVHLIVMPIQCSSIFTYLLIFLPFSRLVAQLFCNNFSYFYQTLINISKSSDSRKFIIEICPFRRYFSPCLTEQCWAAYWGIIVSYRFILRPADAVFILGQSAVYTRLRPNEWLVRSFYLSDCLSNLTDFVALSDTFFDFIVSI